MKRILNERIGKIRDLINSPRKQSALLKDSALWNMLCSSLDTTQDTELGLDALLTKDFDDFDVGIKYLIVYGALQALFMQQEAVENLCKSLKIQDTADPELNKILEIYNDSVGHPTKRGEGNGEAFNFISRATLNFQGFQLMTTYADETKTNFKDVNIPDLIKTQKNIFVGVLDNIIETLRREEMEHRKKFADQNLVSTFQNTTYPFEKIFDVIINPASGHAQLADSYVDRILESIESFRNQLKKRGEPDESYIYDYLDYSLQRLKVFFHNRNVGHINEKDAYILANFAQRQIQDLKAIAQQLDEEYNQEVASRIQSIDKANKKKVEIEESQQEYSIEVEDSDPLSENEQLNLRYWTGLREYMVEKGNSVNCPKPTTYSYLRWFILIPNFYIQTSLLRSGKEIRIWLYLKGDNAKAHFRLLKEQQEEIHNEIGKTLEWHELPDNERSRICLHKGDTDPTDKNDWLHQYEWFTTHLELFVEVFRERIQKLNAADWSPS